MIDKDLYERVRQRLAEIGHGEEYTWSQGLKPPATAEALVCEYTWVAHHRVPHSAVEHGIMDRVWPRLVAGGVIGDAFKHPAKRAAIEMVWRLREDHYSCFKLLWWQSTTAILDWCQSLPWIGGITKYHLAKNLGVDVAKPDRWLERLAGAEGATVALCERLARETGDRIATVDVVLWRACVEGVLWFDGDDLKARC